LNVADDLIDALANIAMIGPNINIRISKQDPMNYIPKYQITAQKLKQQFIPTNVTATKVEDYPKRLNARAENLARAGNSFLEDVTGDIHLPKVTIASEKQRACFCS